MTTRKGAKSNFITTSRLWASQRLSAECNRGGGTGREREREGGGQTESDWQSESEQYTQLIYMQGQVGNADTQDKRV